MNHPLIIALVGIDGSGKTTQAHNLVQWLSAMGIHAQHMKNPGGRMLLDKLARSVRKTDAADLFGVYGFAAIEICVRWLLIAKNLIRAKVTNSVAIMDRYSYCEFAMIKARNNRGERFTRALFSVFPQPDIVCYFTIDPRCAYQRIAVRGIDTESLLYLEKLGTAYQLLPEYHSWHQIDANCPADVVTRQLQNIISAKIGNSSVIGMHDPSISQGSPLLK